LKDISLVKIDIDKWIKLGLGK